MDGIAADIAIVGAVSSFWIIGNYGDAKRAATRLSRTHPTV